LIEIGVDFATNKYSAFYTVLIGEVDEGSVADDYFERVPWFFDTYWLRALKTAPLSKLMPQPVLKYLPRDISAKRINRVEVRQNLLQTRPF